MSDVPDKFRAEAAEIAQAQHGAARDDRDVRQDDLTSRLLGMYERLQNEMFGHMATESTKVQELKDGLARVETKVEAFVSAFPNGDAILHRLAHEEDINKNLRRENFFEKMKFAFWALVMASATVWGGIVVWKAFLMGPK